MVAHRHIVKPPFSTAIVLSLALARPERSRGLKEEAVVIRVVEHYQPLSFCRIA
jgi:hypothetical protein